MAIQDDFSISPNKEIRYTGSTANYTVLELHRHLQDLADNASSNGDDILDITDGDPSEKKTDEIISLINGYNIDDATAEHIYNGSISQDDGNTLYSGLLILGTFNNPATEVQIIQNGVVLPSYWGTGLNAIAGAPLRIMVKSIENGVSIDGGRLTVQTQELGDTYAITYPTLALGNAIAPLQTQPDLNNQTDEATIASWASDFANVEGLNLIDVNNNGVVEEYYSQWDISAPRTINDLYEYAKYITRRGSTDIVYGLNGDLFKGITHSVVYSNGTGDFTVGDYVTFNDGSTAQVLAFSANEMQIQVLTGVAPSSGDTFTDSGSSNTGTVDSVVARSVPSVFIGSSTGSALIGGFGVGATPTDLTNNDQLFDLSNTPQSPPNFVTFSVTGLSATEDYVLVGPESGGTIDNEQLSANGAHAASDTTFEVNEVIPTDTPPVGSIRVFNGQTFVKVLYASYTGNTFTLVSTLGADVADGASSYISYIDTVASAASASFTSVFDSPRSLFVRVRDGGDSPIKTFETPASLGSAGGSAQAIRQSDA